LVEGSGSVPSPVPAWRAVGLSGWGGVVVIVALAVLAGLPGLYCELDNDQALWLCPTRDWLRGASTPYETLFDNKPIAIYLACALALRSPWGAVPGLGLLAIVTTAMTSLVAAGLVARSFGRPAALVTGALLPLGRLVLRTGALMPEDLQALFSVLAVAVFLRGSSRLSWLRVWFAGLLWGCAVVSKQSAGVPLVGFVVFALLPPTGPRGVQRWTRAAGLLLAAALPVAGFLAWLSIAGGQGLLKEWVLAALPFTGLNTGVMELGWRLKGLLKVVIVLTELAPLALPALYGWGASSGGTPVAWLKAWVLLELACYLFPGTGFEHQAIPLAVALAALAGVGGASLCGQVRDCELFRLPWRAGMALLYAGGILLASIEPQELASPVVWFKARTNMRTDLAPSSTYELLGRWIAVRTGVEDRLLAPPQVLWYADRRSTSRTIVYAMGRTTRLCRAWRDAFEGTFRDMPPVYVVGDVPPLCSQARQCFVTQYERIALPVGVPSAYAVYRRTAP